MPLLRKYYESFVSSHCMCIKFAAHMFALAAGVLVTTLAYLSLTRLNVLSVESQRWGLHQHQKHLAHLSIAEIFVGSALALASVLGCVETLIAKKAAACALDAVAGVIILAQISVSLAALTLMVWVENDIPPRRTNCKGCMRNLQFVCQRLIPAIAASLFASALTQCCVIVINKVLANRHAVQLKLDRANNLGSYKLRSLNINRLSGTWNQRKTFSTSSNVNFSGSLFHNSLADCPSVFGTPKGQGTNARKSINVQLALVPRKQPVRIVVTQPSDEVTTALSRSWPSSDVPLPPNFSHYANVE